MWYPTWPVLVVDDEPDVLQLSKLLMKNIEVDGVPVRVYTAASKAEAIELLRTEFMEEAGPGLLPVAFIDVVMETDTAGLDLCNFIRNEMGNGHVQLYIRTGQPGIAPERKVIDNYNISGYFTKVEATEDKLYTLVKSGIRQYWTSTFGLISTMMLTDVIQSYVAGEPVGKSSEEKLSMIAQKRDSADASGRMAMWSGDNLYLNVGYQASEAEATRRRLSQMQSFPIGPMGEKVIMDSQSHQVLIYTPAGPNNPEATFLGDGYGKPDITTVMMMSWNSRAFASLWQYSQMRQNA